MPVTNFRNVEGRIVAQSKAGVSSEYLFGPLGSVVSNRTTYCPYQEVLASKIVQLSFARVMP